MTNAIAELRDLNLELESLKDRKNAIKTKLAEHRDSFTDEDITNSTAEANEIRTQIASVQEKIKVAQERAKIEEEKRGDKNYMENNENVEKRSSIEYRKAFMDYIQRGVKSDILETRADAATTTTTLLYSPSARQEPLRANIRDTNTSKPEVAPNGWKTMNSINITCYLSISTPKDLIL